MLEIAKLDQKLFVLPKRMGRAAALKNLSILLSTALTQDILSIVKNRLPSDVKNDLVIPLSSLKKEMKHFPDGPAKELTFIYLRIMALVIKNRIDTISDKSVKAELQNLLVEFSQQFGVVPELNGNVPLPDDELMPAKYYDDTKKKWRKIAWLNPSRYSKKEKLSFFSRHDKHTSSVREHLLRLDEGILKEKHYGLSYAHADFYHIGDLQADHLQPASQIVERQQELLMAMNFDPLYKIKILSAYKGSGYFIKKSDGKVFGTKKFFMEYHNCVGNLWFISTAANTGVGKGDEDPIEWLATHPKYGDEFFKSLDSKGQDPIVGRSQIQQHTILYTLPDGQFLAEAARRWFRKYYKEQIDTAKITTYELKQPLAKEIEEIIEARSRGGSWKHRSMRMIAKLAMMRWIISDVELPESSSPSPAPGSPASTNSSQSRSADYDSDAAMVNEENVDSVARNISKRGKKRIKETKKLVLNDVKASIKRPRRQTPT